MADAVTPWWQAVDEAVESLVAALTAAAARAARRGSRKRPRGRPRPKRRAKSTRRHLADVIRSHRLAPGVTADRNTVAALFAGHRKLVTDPVLTVAVARACAIIAGHKLTAKEAGRLRSASIRIGKLIAYAEQADRAAAARPALPAAPIPAAPIPAAPAIPRIPAIPAASSPSGPPDRPRVVRGPGGATVNRRRRGRRRRWLAVAAVLLLVAAGALVAARAVGSGSSAACRAGTRAGDILAVPIGEAPVPMDPTLDFGELHGSVWRADQGGRTYYWATAGSAVDRPVSGGARVRWRFDTGGPWHDCAVTFRASTRDSVRTPGVATTVAGRPVQLQACLWRDDPYRQQCTAVGGLRGCESNPDLPPWPSPCRTYPAGTRSRRRQFR